MNEMKAIIIGAGPAGLTAAYELAERTDIKSKDNIIAANTIYRIFARHPKGLAVVLIEAFAVPSVFVFNRVKKDNRRQLEIVEYVLSITDSTDCIYDGNAAFNLFRKDIDFFWFSVKSARALRRIRR